MNQREKTLGLVVGALAGLCAAGFAFRGVIVKPLRDLAKRTDAVRQEIIKIKNERRAYFAAEEQMKGFALRAFADTVDQASAKSGEALTRQILQSGLSEADFTRLPVGPRKLRGADEIGWSVQGEGPLANVVNLLFLLQESPHLHRVEGLVVSDGEAPGTVKVRLRFLTLVVEPTLAVERKELPPKFTLSSVERHLFDGIVTRDLLRPYIQRPNPVAPGQGPGGSQPGTRPGAPPGPESFRIVSLSEWMGQPEIHIRDLTAQRTLRYRPGDHLAGGTVVCVDYRPLPLPGNALLRSDSRVILRIGAEYWAIERGRTLADKRKLAAEHLPAELAKAK